MQYEDKTPRAPRGTMSERIGSLVDPLLERPLALMRGKRRREKANFVIYRMVGVVLALSTVLLAFRADITLPQADVDWRAEDQEVIDLNQITVFEEPKPVERVEAPKQRPEPRSRPAPQAPPVEVPDEVQRDPVEELRDFSADLDLGEELDVAAPEPAAAPAPPPPPPTPEPTPEPRVFVVAEQMPELIGGIGGLQKEVEYPEMAHRAGVEGRVMIQFVVDEEGRVTEPRVLKGIGAGADEEALRVVRSARFVPGMQNGRPVKVKMTLPITFKLQ